MKFDLFSAVNNKKERKKGPNVALSNVDFGLLLAAFSSIFGILHFRVFSGQPVNSTITGLILTVIFAVFWLGMAFSGGRYTRKGFYIAAAIIWGMSLLCCLANLNGFALFKGNGEGTILSSLAGVIVILLAMFVSATVSPLLPGLAYLGYQPKAPWELIVICVGFAALIAAAYTAGYLFQKKKVSTPRKSR